MCRDKVFSGGSLDQGSLLGSMLLCLSDELGKLAPGSIDSRRIEETDIALAFILVALGEINHCNR